MKPTSSFNEDLGYFPFCSKCLGYHHPKSECSPTITIGKYKEPVAQGFEDLEPYFEVIE